MTVLRVLLARIRGLLSHDRADATLDDDVTAHLELLTRDYMDRGLSPREARAAARRAFGHVDQMRETYRDQRGLPALEMFLQDLTYAVRMLRRAPAFAVVAVLSLATGIAAATGVFSIVNAALLNPFPFADINRIVRLDMNDKGKPRGLPVTARQLVALQHSDVLDGAFLTNNWEMTLTGQDLPEAVATRHFSASGLDVLGVHPSSDEYSPRRTGLRASSPNGSSSSPIGSGSHTSAGGLRRWDRSSI